MKIRWIFALGLLVVVLISCQCLRKRSQDAVRIEEHSILIPGTAISTADQEALSKIFRKYDRSLYRVAVYEKGSLKKQIGKMDEMQLADVTKDYSRNATATGLSSWIFQLGLRTHVTHYGPSTHVTTGQPTHVTHPDFASIEQESDALVKEVTPVLEKYSK